jgi:hypothetical protein
VNCESTSPAYQPSDFELRTLGAILFQSIRDAWQRGEDRVWFRGYCIEARRIDAADVADMGHSLLMLTLRIAGAAGMRDRRFIAVAPYPIPGAGFDIELIRVRAVAPRRLRFHVGCVSPIDARNASPETGQIS